MVTQDVPDYAQQVAPTLPGTTQTYLPFTIVASASGVTQQIAGVATKQIVVCAFIITVNAAVNIKWQSHTIPTDLTGLYYFTEKGGAVAPFIQSGWFRTIAGEALDLNLSSAVAVGGHGVYVLV